MAGENAANVIVVPIFQAISALLTVFAAIEHIRALHGAGGCL